MIQEGDDRSVLMVPVPKPMLVVSHGAVVGGASGAVSFSTNNVVLGRSTAGGGLGEEIPFTSFARTLAAVATAAAACLVLGVGVTDTPTFGAVTSTAAVTADSAKIRISRDGTDSFSSNLGASFLNGSATAGPAIRVYHPLEDNHFWITPYQYGMGFEYDGVLECWVTDFSVQSSRRDVVGLPLPPRFWVGNNIDSGGIRVSGVSALDGSGQYGEIVSERYNGTSHGDMRLVVRNATDKWDFRAGAFGADATVAVITAGGNIYAGGKVVVGASADADTATHANLRIRTTAGAAPSANEVTSAVALVSTTTAAANVGPNLRFMGQSGNGVAEYTFAMIQGHKASNTPGDYSGAITFSVIDAVGSVTSPMLLTLSGVNSTVIGADFPAAARFTTATITQYLAGTEIAAPSAPAANGWILYGQDNGAGKTQLMALFSSGAAQQVAIQP